MAAPHDPDGVLMAMAGAERRRARASSATSRSSGASSLEISGGDLAELGLTESPQVGAILEEILRRKVNGELDGRDAELAAARELIGAS